MKYLGVVIEGIVWLLACISFSNELGMLREYGLDFGGVWQFGYILFSTLVAELVVIVGSPVVVYWLVKSKPKKWRLFWGTKLVLLLPLVVVVVMKLVAG